MTNTIKNASVIATVLITLVGISKVTENNYMDLHVGVRPVVEYTESNASVDTANLMVRANTF